LIEGEHPLSRKETKTGDQVASPSGMKMGQIKCGDVTEMAEYGKRKETMVPLLQEADNVLRSLRNDMGLPESYLGMSKGTPCISLRKEKQRKI
jgi:hypothetical protein